MSNYLANAVFMLDTCVLVNFEDYPELNKQSGNYKNEF